MGIGLGLCCCDNVECPDTIDAVQIEICNVCDEDENCLLFWGGSLGEDCPFIPEPNKIELEYDSTDQLGDIYTGSEGGIDVSVTIGDPTVPPQFPSVDCKEKKTLLRIRVEDTASGSVLHLLWEIDDVDSTRGKWLVQDDNTCKFASACNASINLEAGCCTGKPCCCQDFAAVTLVPVCVINPKSYSMLVFGTGALLSGCTSLNQDEDRLLLYSGSTGDDDLYVREDQGDGIRIEIVLSGIGQIPPGATQINKVVTRLFISDNGEVLHVSLKRTLPTRGVWVVQPDTTCDPDDACNTRIALGIRYSERIFRPDSIPTFTVDVSGIDCIAPDVSSLCCNDTACFSEWTGTFDSNSIVKTLFVIDNWVVVFNLEEFLFPVDPDCAQPPGNNRGSGSNLRVGEGAVCSQGCTGVTFTRAVSTGSLFFAQMAGRSRREGQPERDITTPMDITITEFNPQAGFPPCLSARSGPGTICDTSGASIRITG